MGDTWVTDINDLFPLGAPLGEMPEPARRLGAYLAAIAGAGSLAPPGERVQTPLRCRRRPGHHACPGYIDVLRLDVPAHIHWSCTSCDDNGLIQGWQGSLWDLSQLPEDVQAAADHDETEVHLQDEEYQLLRGISVLDTDSERIVLGARRAARGGARLRCSDEELEELLGFVAFEANHESQRQRQQRLDHLYERMAHALDGL